MSTNKKETLKGLSMLLENLCGIYNKLKLTNTAHNESMKLDIEIERLMSLIESLEEN